MIKRATMIFAVGFLGVLLGWQAPSQGQVFVSGGYVAYAPAPVYSPVVYAPPLYAAPVVTTYAPPFYAAPAPVVYGAYYAPYPAVAPIGYGGVVYPHDGLEVEYKYRRGVWYVDFD